MGECKVGGDTNFRAIGHNTHTENYGLYHYVGWIAPMIHVTRCVLCGADCSDELKMVTAMLDTHSEARLQEVLPALAEKIRQMAVMLEQENILIRVVQGLRSWKQQDDLYAQGRTAPGAKVTNCPGGHSYHNFGMAVDCAPSVNGVEQAYAPDWNAAHPSWKRMEAVGISLGLDSGATWRSFPDAPHFQLTGRFPEGSPNDEVRQLFKDGGMQAVWAEM